MFPDAKGGDPNEEENEGNPGTEVNQPELNNGHRHIAFRHALDPAGMPLDEGARVEVIGCNPDTESSWQNSKGDYQ